MSRAAVVQRHEWILEHWGPGRSYTLPEFDQEAGQRGADGGRTALEAPRRADTRLPSSGSSTGEEATYTAG